MGAEPWLQQHTSLSLLLRVELLFSHFSLLSTVYLCGVIISSGLPLYFRELGAPLLLHILYNLRGDFHHNYSSLAEFLWALCSSLWSVSQRIWSIEVLYDNRFLCAPSSGSFYTGVATLSSCRGDFNSHAPNTSDFIDFLNILSSIECQHKYWQWFFSFPF